MSTSVEARSARLRERLDGGTEGAPVRLGRYDVVGYLGRGGMGTVYLGVDRERGHRVAIKLLSRLDSKALIHFKDEFRSVADLRHDNLVGMHELSNEDGVMYFVMEHVEGVDFVRWARHLEDTRHAGLASSRTLMGLDDDSNAPSSAGSEFSLADMSLTEAPDEPLTGTISDPSTDWEVRPPSRTAEPSAPSEFGRLRDAMVQLVRGVQALHRHGVLHLDLKPSNILVTETGRVVVLDFGLVRHLTDATVDESIRSAGTPAYMAPEQIMGDRPNEAADWYALGGILYRALTGRRPFVANSIMAMQWVKMTTVPPSPHELLPEVPLDLSDLSIALLNSDPKQRPDGAELLQLLGASDDEAAHRTTASLPYVGRRAELSRLHDALASLTAESGPAVVHVHGPSGIGKSALMRQFLREIRSRRSTWLFRGRCYERESIPYKGFDGLLDRLARHLRRLPRPKAERYVPDKFTPELVAVFPVMNLVEAFADHSRQRPAVSDPMELRRRAWQAVREMFAAIGARRPVVLHIDDFQWADRDTAELLASLTSGEGLPNTLVSLTYRTEEASQNPEIQQWFEGSAGRSAVDITLGPLSAQDAAELARVALTSFGVSDEAATSVAEEAAGIPFFLEELTRYLGEVNDASVTDISLDEMLVQRVARLPEVSRRLVEVAAVAGGPVRQRTAFEVAGLKASELPVLWELRAANLLAASGVGPEDPLELYHDRLRQAVVEHLPRDVKQRHHRALGASLAGSFGDEDGPWLFDAVRHFQACSELLDADEQALAAQLALRAGDRAKRGAAFPLAFEAYESGLGWLAEGAWEADYDLALGLYTGAAQSAYLTAQWDILDARYAEVRQHARTAMDEAVAAEVAIDGATARGEYAAAVAMSHRMLNALGVELPDEPTEADVGAAFTAALELLTRIGEDGLLALPDVEDPMVLAAMKIQIRAAPAAYFAAPLLLPLIACNLIQTSARDGLSTATPYALGLFGIVLNTMAMYDVSHTWGEVGKKLLTRWDDRSLEASTRHVLENLVTNWLVPLRDTVERTLDIYAIGLETGDFEYAGYSAHNYLTGGFYAGAYDLAPLRAKGEALGDELRALGVNAVIVHEPFEQLVKSLVGDTEGPGSLDDDRYTAEESLELALSTGAMSGAVLLYANRGFAQTLCGDAMLAVEYFKEARVLQQAAPSTWHIPSIYQYGAVATVHVWDRLSEERRAEERAALAHGLEMMKGIARFAPANAAHKVSLMEGVVALLDGDVSAARALFVTSVEQALAEQWRNDAGMAWEMIAVCDDDPTEALSNAKALYQEWGATAAVARLSG